VNQHFMHIAKEPANQPEVLALIEQLDAYQMPLYPAESHHGIDMAALSQPNVIFAVARDPSGQAVACGAIVIEPAYGELKRMFTLPSHRAKASPARCCNGWKRRRRPVAAIFSCSKPATFNPKPSLCMRALATAVEALSARTRKTPTVCSCTSQSLVQFADWSISGCPIGCVHSFQAPMS
jgi:hypothetical protein